MYDFIDVFMYIYHMYAHIKLLNNVYEFAKKYLNPLEHVQRT